MLTNRDGTRAYLTEQEAKEFHRIFMTSFIVFTVIAIVAHILVWQWRPWLPGPNGYAMIDAGRSRPSTSLTEGGTTCGESGCCSIRAGRWSRLFIFLFVLALLIHFILLSTDRFNWLDGPHKARAVAAADVADAGAATPTQTVAARDGTRNRRTGRRDRSARPPEPIAANAAAAARTGEIAMAHAELRAKIPRPRRHADRRRPVRLLGRAVLRRLLRRDDDLLRRARHRC